jgi:hypothetical protein
MGAQDRRSGSKGSWAWLSWLPAAALLLLPRASQAYHVYYANLHSHCALSDGIGTPQEAFAYARDVANIDVLALTDHTHMISVADFNYLLSVADAYTQPGVFVALGAQEFGNLNDFGHMNVYDSPYRIPYPSSDLISAYGYIQTVGALGCFNPPSPDYGTNFNNLAFVQEYEGAMRAIEMRNGLATDNYEPQFLQALGNGWKIGPFAGQDNHEGHWGDQQNPNAGGAIYLTGILADSLTKPAILGALHARRFFAMEVDPPSDRMELDFRVDGHPMGTVDTTDINPAFDATARAVNGMGIFNRFDLFRDGVICNTQIVIGTTIDYHWADLLADGETHYYFIRAHQVDGNYCWSSPVWVTARATETAAPSGDEGGRLAPLSGHPNPMTGSTELRFTLPPGPTVRSVRLMLCDLSGRRVRDFGSRDLPTGTHGWTWDGRDQEGRPLPTGVYFAHLSGAGLVGQSLRLVLLR